jgi:rare lipoprotein A
MNPLKTNSSIPNRTLSRNFAIALLGLLPLACASVGEQAESTAETKGPRVVHTEQGRASYYSIRSNGGRHTASGERLCEDSMTAAHRTLPMGTRVRVTNLNTGRSVVVRINNRGPFIRGRVIDVTKGAAQELNMIRSGVVPVEVEVLAAESADSEVDGRS